MSDFIVYAKRGRMKVLGFFSLLFVLVGIVISMISLTEPDPPILILVIGIVCIVFFGYGFIYFVRELNSRKPVLIVSDEGMMDRSTALAAGLIRWEEISDLDFVDFGGQVFLAIYTFDPELIVNRSHGLKKLLYQINKGLIDAQVNIPVKNLDCNIEQLVQEINHRWEQYIEKTQP